jgi:hypothetical protein
MRCALCTRQSGVGEASAGQGAMNYSYRNTFIGSTRDALRAGM